ncbi:uncharacterized protein F5891DRAFT_528685 [Suillus fuscotomentosus]|uniref:Uncharacterized protein n=1 Tax=Suillus fuscotomentosus TaxID=1912939 RepID=A0AAD4HH44_9AGAM|nr:uncharacterized protein F5891DRAFT_528685 [Suillus fuscotomentosus]KAG1897435.1 hypothetical protein F5891DRAFT_528685 [Suillus fuscotomentosus]
MHLKWSCAFLCWSIVVVFVYLSILLSKFPRLHMANSYWLMGAISNDPAKFNFAGFYNCFQSSRSAIVWRLDALHMNIFIST